jgi:DNA invertase Pin-like site-specific DNA recombinase
MGKLIGYARVSTKDQNLDPQLIALRNEGVAEENIYREKKSGTSNDRPELAKALAALEPGDTLIVWKLDRFGRSLRHLVDSVDDLRRRGVGFKCLTQREVNTTDRQGKLVFHIFAALAEFERDLISERTMAGLEAARAKGHKGGRPRVMSGDRLDIVRQMRRDQCSIRRIAEAIGMSNATVVRYLKILEEEAA